MTNDLLRYGENICAFPQKLGSHFSYMTLHLIPSEFSYTVYQEIFFLFFISALELKVLSSPLSVIFRQNISKTINISLCGREKGTSISQKPKLFQQIFRQNEGFVVIQSALKEMSFFSPKNLTLNDAKSYTSSFLI
jgi:hypothetical protein